MRTIRGILLIVGLMAAVGTAAQAQTTAFTYQGQLKDGGTPANGSYDLKFELYDAVTDGSLLGTVTQTLPVTIGVFTASLDFGSQFPGAGRWLAISVGPGGSGTYTPLTPRQPLTPTPYALGLELPFAGAADVNSHAFSVTNTTGAAVAGTNTNATSVTSAGVVGISTATDGNGVSGIADSGASAYGVFGEAVQGTAVYANSSSGQGVYATSGTGVGVHGVSDSAAGVLGESSTGAGVYGIDSGSTASTSAGVVGEGQVANGNGVAGIANQGPFAYGVYGESSTGLAGYFNGNVHVAGNLSKAGGSFKIDHPLDPANKYLSHSFVESPDMMNIYNGNVTTGADGYATVTLPDWFGTLNRDFRYQLTVIDDNNSADFVQAKIVSRISNNQFTLRTSQPLTTVSWQVTGIRQDPWANAHRIPVEEEKTGIERGRYLHPELFGAPAELSMQAAKATTGTPNRPISRHELPAIKAPMARPATTAPGKVQ